MVIRQNKRRRCLAQLVEAMERRIFLSSVYYVDANAEGNANGLSWANAFPSLQQATALAVSGDRIDVAGGTYKPTTTTDTTVSFNLSSGVGIYGGYAGSASGNPNTRNVSLYPTILSGDISLAGYSGDNSQVVLTAYNSSTSTTLDGVTITGSQGSAGMQILSGSPTVSDCIFRSNQGTYFGGAIEANYGTSPTIIDCTFVANTAESGSGIYNNYGTLTAINDVFVGNTGVGTYYAAAGIYTNSGKSIITNCTFTANIGAAVAQSQSQVLLSNSILWGDATRPQDEVYDESSPTTTASYDDIAGAFVGTANLNTDPMFVRNPSPGPDGVWGTADDDLGNLSLQPFSPVIDAGYNAELPTSVQTDIAGGNRFQLGPVAGRTGSGSGAVDLGAYETAPVLAASTGGPYYIAAGQSIMLHGLGTSATAGGLSYSWDLNGDGVFSDSNSQSPTFSTNGLSVGSVIPIKLKVTDAGSASVISSSTLSVVAPTLFVDSHATGANNGQDWADAFTTLSSALSSAVNSQVIEVAGGTYTPTSGGDTSASFQLKNGVQVYGSYAGSANPSNPNLRNSTAYPAILSGAIGNSNVSQTVVTGTGTNATAVLNGVTISGGSLALNDDPGSPTIANCTFVGNSATVSNYISSPSFSGCTFNASGVVSNNSASPAFSNCSFLNNEAYADGGAMNNNAGSSPLISGCTFTGNSSYSSYGGAIFDNSSSPTIINSVFTRNTANLDGGAIYGQNGSITLTGCTFLANKVGAFEGGAVCNFNTNATITSCIFEANSAGDGGAIENFSSITAIVTNSLFIGNHANNGGAIENEQGAILNMSNCTLVANSAAQSGGALYDNDTLPTLTNSILWNNNASSGSQFYYTSIHASYCDIGQTFSGTGNVANLNTDPKFVRNPSPGPDGVWGTADDDYGDEHLQISSPLVNAGSNAAVPAGLTTDLGGSPRISGPAVDIGAYETVYTATVTGNVFVDANGDGNLSDAMNASSGLTVYIDANNNGLLDSGETSYQTNSAGQVTFTGLSPGTYVFRQSLNPAQWVQTVPAANGAITLTVTAGQSAAFTMADFQTQSVHGVYTTSSITGIGVVPSGTPLQLILNPPNNGTPIPYTASTDANGYYSVTGLGPGSITVTPSVPAGGYSVSPSMLISQSLSGGSSADNFIATAQGSITGTVFADANDNGMQDSGEASLIGVQVSLDVLNAAGGSIVIAIPAATDSTGRYLFSSVPAGSYIVQEYLPAAYAGYSTPATGSYTLNSFSGGTSTGNNFGNLESIPSKQLTGTVIGTSGSYNNDGNTIAKAVDGNLTTYFDAPTSSGAWVGLDLGSPMVVTSLAYASRSGWASRMNGGVFQASNSSTFASGVVNLYTIASNANPPSGSLTTQNVTNSTAYRYVRYLGPSGGYCDVAEIEFFGTPPVISTPAWLSPGNGAVYTFNGSSLNISAGNVSIVGDPLASGQNVSIAAWGSSVVQFQAMARIGSLALNNASSAVLAGNQITLVITSLSLSNSAKIDLKNNALVVNYIANNPSPVAALTGYLLAGLATKGATGLFTSGNSAPNDTSIGIIDNAAMTAQGTGVNTFAGTPVTTDSILIKYSYNGDTNLDGKVDGTDYSRIDSGSLNHLTGWFNGDFNYDGIINGSDYTLIDNAYNTQGASLAAQIAQGATVTRAGRAVSRKASVFSQSQVSTPANDFTGEWARASGGVAAGMFTFDDDSLLRAKGKRLFA